MAHVVPSAVVRLAVGPDTEKFACCGMKTHGMRHAAGMLKVVEDKNDVTRKKNDGAGEAVQVEGSRSDFDGELGWDTSAMSAIMTVTSDCVSTN